MRHHSNESLMIKRRGAIPAMLRCLAFAGAVAVASGPTLAGSGGGKPKQSVVHAASMTADADTTVVRGSAFKWQGQSLSDLAERWYHWFESIPIGVVPHGDSTGANCGIDQSGPVWFLSGPTGDTFVKACTIPAGKAIMSPVFNVIDDYPCPKEFNFEPSVGQGIEAFLKADIVQYLNLDYATATLDGVPLRVHRVRTPLFNFTAAASNVASDPCITGSPQLAVTEGYYVFIDPPPRGRHVLQLRSSANAGFGIGPTDVTINLTIQ